jgi:hypothetical protein
MLFEGVCGELELPVGVRQLLCMNSVEDSAGGYDIAAPLANRVGWLEFPAPEVEGFTSYMMGVGGGTQAPITPATEEAEVDSMWNAAWAQAAGQVCGFLRSKSDMLHAMPPSGSKASSEAWASPRTWEMAARAKAAGYVYDLTDLEVSESVSAFVGNAANLQFHTWVRHNDLPSPTDVLDGAVAFTHDPRRLDRTAAVLTSATSLVIANAKGAALGSHQMQQNAARTEVLWKLLGTLCDIAPDIGIGSITGLCQARLMVGSATAYKVISHMEPILRSAGITPDVR